MPKPWLSHDLWGTFEVPLECSGGGPGEPCVVLGVPFGRPVKTMVLTGRPTNAFGVPLGCLWDAFGGPWGIFGVP